LWKATPGKECLEACSKPERRSYSTPPIRKPEGNKPSSEIPLKQFGRIGIFGLCGITNFRRRMFGVVVTSTERQRREWLDEVRRTVDSQFPSYLTRVIILKRAV